MSEPAVEYVFLERVRRRTLLGIRFWDPALDAQIADDLRVTLSPLDNPGKIVVAYRTRSGIYAFDGIPGMQEQETGSSGVDLSSPPTQRSYILTVDDPGGQFTTVAQVVNLPLPYSGLFLVDDEFGSPDSRPRGFNLYSAVSRLPQSQYVFVRGDLIDAQSSAPAAHALVRVITEEDISWFGIADDLGRFCVMMPYPFLHITYGSSPPVNDGVRLFQRAWNIRVSVMYAPGAQVAVPGTDTPGYFSVLGQGQSLVYLHSPGSAAGEASEISTQLNYGRDLVVSTDGFSELYVSPTGSPA